jgi:5,10-methylenetetrahydromethanopterin reductase
MDISCAFPPTPQTPDHIVLAEQLGYKRAWAYDTPALQLDVWMTLARAAERTSRIELGPAALIPHLRHVMTTAAAIATLSDLAPGRVNVVIGTGFSGRLAMGQRPLSWRLVTQYVRQLRALLSGEMVEVEGALTRMLHATGQAPTRPIPVPILLAIAGPKGQAAARSIADAVFTPFPISGFDWSALLLFGTVLDPGESPHSPRVLAAAGPGTAIRYHAVFERAGRKIDPAALPGFDRWQEMIQVIPERERHLHIHEGHLTLLNELDSHIISGELITAFSFTGEREALSVRLAAFEQAGATEIVFQPGGADIARELTAFAKMADL